MFPLYVTGLPGEITLDDLIIYFQSGKSGGGDVDYEACKLDGDKAVIVFEKKEYLENVLQRNHELDGHKLRISAEDDKRKKPVPKRRTRKKPEGKPEEKPNDNQNQPDAEKAHLGEVRTVIVSGLCPDSTNETVEMFFESSRRSCGGKIEKLERLEPGVTHITFTSAEVAAQVLKQDKLELDGYLLQLKEKQPELVLPVDRKKLYVENINPNTSEDSLWNYMEIRAKEDVSDIQFGDNGNAFVTFKREPDMKKVYDYKKKLEGAVLKISNPPVCNSVLVTGLSKKTTKQGIEMYFENERNGGGKIYGDIIYQKDKGIAVVSFCDPNVVRSLIDKRHKLDQSLLTLRQHHQFMETITEITTRVVKLDARVLDHAVRNFEKELLDLFGAKILESLKENNEEMTLPSEAANEMEKYMAEFSVEKVKISKKLLDDSRNELEDMITKTKQANISVVTNEEQLRIELVGKKADVKNTRGEFRGAIAKMEKGLNIVTEEIPNVPKTKFALLSLHGAIEMLEKDFHVQVVIEQRKNAILLKGTGKHVSHAKMEVLQKCSQIIEETVDLNKNEKRFLEQGGLDLINDCMKQMRLKGMISLSQVKGNKAKILVFDGAKVADVESHLKINMYQKQYTLDEDSRTLLNSNKWEEFCRNVMTGTSVMIFTNQKSAEISLIGKKPEVEQSYNSLEEFMKRNTIVKESVDLEEGYLGYLTEYCEEHIRAIEKELEEHSVRVNFVEDAETVIINGTKEGVKKARKQLHDIVSTIAKDTIFFDKLRSQKYLKSEEGKILIEGVEAKNKCLIRLTEDNGRISTTISSTRSKPQPGKRTSKLLCSYETQEKISLKVYKDDITAHRCDVIVNAANGDLKHIGGVAKSILDAGGREIQDECDENVKENGKLFDGECFSGSPGKLPCKVLVHAVGPRWDSNNRKKTRKLLSVTCTKALEEAMQYQSIAIPAIGSGIFGVPKDVCAEVMIEAAEEFGRKYDNSSLREIHFVNNDDESGHVFVKKFREKFRGRPSFMDNEGNGNRRRARPSVQPRFRGTQPPKRTQEAYPTEDVSRRRKPDDLIITKQNMKISVVVGDLSTYKADVLVNTTGENLKLDSNPCGKALSNEAGPTLQAECSRIGSLKVGQVAVTTGGNLLCDEVYHVVCVQWSGGQGEQVLRAIIKDCLKKCNSNGKTSIAFPPLEQVLGFPHDVAAKIFFEEAKGFGTKFPNSSVKEVSFVVYSQDAKSIQAFKNQLQQQPESSTNEGVKSEPAVKSQDRWRKKPSTPHETKDSVLCVEVGNGKKVDIVRGDITKETTDVIAHLTNPGLVFHSGVANALSRAGGGDIEGECEEKARSAKPSITTTVLTTAGRLNAKYIAHMVASSDPSSNEIEKCITNCLKEVTDKECESISFPAVGTGSLKRNPEKAATTIFSSIVRFLQSSSGSVKNVRIVVKDDELVTAFQASIKAFSEGEEPGMFRKFANLFWKTEAPTLNVKENYIPEATTKLFLVIYAKNEATVKKVKEKILNVLESHKKKDKLENPNIENLSSQQMRAIEHLCRMNDLEVDIQKELGRIVVVGHSEDVTKTFSEISNMFKEIEEAEREKEKAALHADFAEIVSQGVQWFYENPTDGSHEDYDKLTNASIEKAYIRKEKSVIFSLLNERCEIVFDKMEETNLDTNQKIKVIRKDLKAESVSIPDYWDPQPRDANGKELAVHLVTLNPNDPKQKDEHKKISDHFNQTAGNQRIQQIQRIQNPSLFKLYLIMKESLDQKGGSNEKFLFHGTAGDKLSEINAKGLNRSFAGNINGVAFGRGVYFARDAQMSAGYAPQHASTGQRYMYYTRAAVGQYAVGNSSMVVPPKKSGNDSYDSVVNNVTTPTIFVLFYDNQYYPEYLITFV
ncbi:LOW QUALITY PROTEIN: protein mono-ADP-ribosyltransferase PARP14-like [Dendronephthya gigantea]|uniref:LOW QUALITY PROTEIN: protein mono-ADP-ribosyltransferase PARP14-like n=1 Tax=Dendronephthya gigantea TaxID=151771 RepID=UPI00106AFA8F|nr:LOW QUALITY PROTEIN: protein mono-ADP-ribosyltransferase PARP14-like [Dendronephthya gigantea]